MLDVVLLTAGKQIIPKQVRITDGWQPVNRLLPPLKGGLPREYTWSIAEYAGQSLQMVLVDKDIRPGCHVFCSGFSLLKAGEFEAADFTRSMLRLAREHQLPAMYGLKTKHFLALSNADESYTAMRLRNCELIYDLFYEHFRRKGFYLQPPAGKLMLAVFDSQAGFEAYLGRKMPAVVTGIYHISSNRLLVYDYGQNEAFLAQKRQSEEQARRIGSDIDRQRAVATLKRRAQEFRADANIGTVMHETAHQLSFNSGMLNRYGDVPLWLAEGLACYCESTVDGAWQGIGEANPERLDALSRAVHGQMRLLPLRDLLVNDDWMRRGDDQTRLLGYAQSWALFRMLMEERPQAVKNYLALIYGRWTPDHRLADFAQAFGSDLDRLELRYTEYVKSAVERQARSPHS